MTLTAAQGPTGSTTTSSLSSSSLSSSSLTTATPTRRREVWPAAGFALTVVGWGANQFAPLVLLYRQRLDMSPAIAEAVFGLYALGLIPGLLVAGPLSDRIGRRPTVVFAVALSMLAGGVLMLGPHGVGWLFLGRVLMGVASGSAFSAGSAWIKELSAAPHSDAPAGSGARRASMAMTVGFGLGPLTAGLLAQWGPAPMVLPYVPQLILGAFALWLARRVPETVQRWTSGVLGDGLLRLRGFADRRFVGVVLPLAPWVFGSATTAMVYLPGLAAGHVSGISLAFAGTAAMLTALSGVCVQPFARRFAAGSSAARPRLLALGLGLVTVGTLASAGIAALDDIGGWQALLALANGVEMGCGYGVLMVFGLSEVQRLAPAEDLAGMTAVFQAFTYVGFALPYLLSSLKSLASPSELLLGVAVLAAMTLAFTLWQAGRTAPAEN